MARLEAGTTLGLMGRGDTAAGMLATVRGHSVEMWRGGICAVFVRVWTLGRHWDNAGL